MSNATQFVDSRRDSRYGVAHGRVLHAALTVKSLDGEDTVHPAVVLDLSRNGSKLKVDRALPNHSGIQLAFIDEAIDVHLSVDGAICWCRPADDDQWLIGCSFEQSLPHELMVALASAGFIDRRSDLRVAYDVAVRCRRQLNNEEIDGTLLNLSVGGFAMRLNEPMEIDEDERILIQVGDTDSPHAIVIGRVCWKGDADNPGLLGCSFVSKDGYPILRQRLAALKIANQHRRGRFRVRALVGLLLGIAVVAAGAALLMRGVPNF